MPVGDTPEGIVIDARAREVAVALRRPDSIALVGLDDPHRVRLVNVPGRARHLRLAAPNGPLLIPGEDTDTVITLALPAATITARYSTPRQPHDAVSVAGRIWVTDELAGSVTVLGSGGRTLAAGLQPGGLDAAGGRVAAADVRGNRLYVYDARTERQVAVLPAGAGPTHVVRVSDTLVAVADTRGGAVLLYDLTGTPRLVDRLPLGGGPYGMAADLERHRLWVALSGRNQLVRLDVAGRRLRVSGTPIATVEQPNSVAVNPRTGEVVVAGATPSGTLQFLAATRS